MTNKLETTSRIEDILFNLNMAIQNYNVRTEINDVGVSFYRFTEFGLSS